MGNIITTIVAVGIFFGLMFLAWLVAVLVVLGLLYTVAFLLA
jgi:hypothetical protein